MTIGKWFMVELQAFAQAMPTIGLRHLIYCLHKAYLIQCLLSMHWALGAMGRPVISAPEVEQEKQSHLHRPAGGWRTVFPWAERVESLRRLLVQGSLGYMRHHLKSVWSHGPYPDSSRSLAVVMTR